MAFMPVAASPRDFESGGAHGYRFRVDRGLVTQLPHLFDDSPSRELGLGRYVKRVRVGVQQLGKLAPEVANRDVGPVPLPGHDSAAAFARLELLDQRVRLTPSA